MATLFLVGTPIGNLEDITLRAQRVLSEVAVIAAEDTRVTRHLLDRYGIGTSMVTFTDAYDSRKQSRLARVIEVLDRGEDVALVSDAGMPGISDPGYQLVAGVLKKGHDVQVVPGPSAITSALVISGLPADRFLFVGFLPRRAAARRALFAQVADEPGTVVAFESPHRLVAALEDLLAVLGNRSVAVGRELTKRFEEMWRGQAADAAVYFTEHPPRGEITLLLGGTGQVRDQEVWNSAQVRSAVEMLTSEGLAPSAVARIVARLSGWKRNDVYEFRRGFGG
ncbi:MAG: 16S rRNA (cytidine(1402)-2'-O)-methyltransferase [Chloroflexota bacterium]|nr:16S rRNA (cytidine(1402)-2'-O)-methyltransferase [Chloroflexota bacterium]